ncbi:MAG: hypothetical protein KIT44_13215 [Opitutaceae bacterium]|nr:hypothetical protein [Opitutaceae bacterium]
MQTALKWREELVQAVVAGEEKPEAALEHLEARRGASGLPLGPEADMGFAAMDLGHRFLAHRRPAEAEIFFRAAEQALARAVAITSDTEAREKAQYLQKLALIRGNYLNQAGQARQDIEAAIKLQPEDEYLARVKSALARRHPAGFRAEVKPEGDRP